MWATGKALLFAALPFWGGAALAECRQALALGLDVSGSVDARDYRLQLEGLAVALTSPEVRASLLSDSMTTVKIAIYQWSGPQSARIIQPWVDITSSDSLDDIAATLRSFHAAPPNITTAIGYAIEVGQSLLDAVPACWRHTLDLSGDGPNNTGPRPQDIPERDDITINGLLILDGRNQELIPYWRTYVIRGPEAFLETASGFEDYEAAMRRKLERELRALTLGWSQ